MGTRSSKHDDKYCVVRIFRVDVFRSIICAAAYGSSLVGWLVIRPHQAVEELGHTVLAEICES